jgi:hypothetical protein
MRLLLVMLFLAGCTTTIRYEPPKPKQVSVFTGELVDPPPRPWPEALPP